MIYFFNTAAHLSQNFETSSDKLTAKSDESPKQSQQKITFLFIFLLKVYMWKNILILDDIFF